MFTIFQARYLLRGCGLTNYVEMNLQLRLRKWEFWEEIRQFVLEKFVIVLKLVSFQVKLRIVVQEECPWVLTTTVVPSPHIFMYLPDSLSDRRGYILAVVCDAESNQYKITTLSNRQVCSQTLHTATHLSPHLKPKTNKGAN